MGTLTGWLFLTNLVSAQAPSSISGDGLIINFTYGTYPLASSGYAVHLYANSGNTYQGIGIYVAADASGTYSYTKTAATTAQINLYSPVIGYGVASVGFSTPTNGTFHYDSTTYPGLYQGGTFVGAASVAPSSIAGESLLCSVADGLLPLASSGSFILSTVSSGNSYTVQGSGGVADSSGTYSYSTPNRSTGMLLINDSNSGPGTFYVGFVEAASGWYAIKSSSGGFQVGNFVFLDDTPPTAAIVVPANEAVLTSSPTTVSGTASDPGPTASGLVEVEVRVNGGDWLNVIGTLNWTGTVELSACSNIIEARSRDSAGNYSLIATTQVTYEPPNNEPETPVNLSPLHGASGISVAPMLQASAFNDPDPACLGDTHAASQWEILKSTGTVVLDTGTDALNKVIWQVPLHSLDYGNTYEWHVRYQDSRGGWTPYSAKTAFTVERPSLTAEREGLNIVVKWPTNTSGFSLQWSSQVDGASWSNVVTTPVIIDGRHAVTNNTASGARFYRLKK